MSVISRENELGVRARGLGGYVIMMSMNINGRSVRTYPVSDGLSPMWCCDTPVSTDTQVAQYLYILLVHHVVLYGDRGVSARAS